MKSIHIPALFSTVSISIMLTIFLWYQCPDIVQYTDRSLGTAGIHVGGWELYHSIFALSLGPVPFLSFLIWSLGKQKNAFIIWLYTVICWGITAGTIYLIGYILIYSGANSFFEVKALYLPFSTFWNYILIITTSLTLLVLLAINLSRSKKIRNNHETESVTIDQIEEPV